MILPLLLSCALTVAQVDTLSTSVVTASVKRQLETEELATPVTSLTLKQIEASGIEAPKGLSGKIPGLFIPDYGSSMTSTIYIRGIGSRMENPVMGLYIDDVPVIDKNHFDFSFLDIRRVDMMRGPQGTLYGRNSMLGVLSVETLSPKVWQGVRAGIEYGSANSLNVNASVYKGAFGAAVAYRHTDGFYTNEYTGKKCDPSDMAAIRLRYSKTRGSIDLDNSLSVSYTDQGGYPYRLYSDGTLNPVSYNDKSAYKRLSVMDGFRATGAAHSPPTRTDTPAVRHRQLPPFPGGTAAGSAVRCLYPGVLWRLDLPNRSLQNPGSKNWSGTPFPADRGAESRFLRTG